MKIRCLKCNDIIESKHVHDLKKCKCGACFIDGGDKMFLYIFVQFYFIFFVHKYFTTNNPIFENFCFYL